MKIISLCRQQLERTIFTLALLLLCLPNGRAAFHEWDIAELYSNEDGTVQFIELFTPFGGQEFLSNHQIRCSGPGGTNTFTFGNNLSAGTAQKTLIIGTTNLASLPGGLKPDFFIPTNFLLRGKGVTNTINFGLNYDTLTYTNLPADGMASLVRSGASLIFAPTNSPKNYAGHSNSIIPVRISQSVLSETNLILSFVTARGTNSTLGPDYIVQFNETVAKTNWMTLQTVPGGNTISTRTVTNPISGSNRFFRLWIP